MIETWKPVIGYEGRYEASSLGFIRSLPKKDTRGNLYGGTILKGTPSNKLGHLKVDLCLSGKSSCVWVHRIVFESFFGPIESPNVVDHIDCNTQNNCIDNLRSISNRLNTSRGINKNNTTSKYIGVNWCKIKKRWRSQIRINGNRKHLGYFKSEKKASDAYRKEFLKQENAEVSNGTH